ncbi:T9SS type A sorting domain-containing protein [Mesohalobacter halotolerans]|uniref:T9SS type A sorting domain-containing protein n=1 Tax=Mesohalobacter halotolerans TaxID=1883405 RepID=A0A4U5TRJ3_9FLAO|nr:T9SS type A sorting domain-containing protein [Mesohalobacter halotolerans]TKS56877.1 T9SS type A sorting domain-containing protein [Mesohalobacter halotolerans]
MKLFTLLFSLLSFSLITAQNINWEKLDIDNALGKATTVDNQGNVITVGAGPMNTNSAGVFVKKYDANGTLLFESFETAIQQQTSGVLEQARPLEVITDSQDNIIVVGFRFHTDNTTCPLPPCIVTRSNKIWKFSPTGQLIFNKTFDDHGRGAFVGVDSNDNIFVNGTGLITDTNNDTEFGTILIKLAPDGTTLFTDVRDVVGTGNSIEMGVMDMGNNFVAVANVTTFDTKLTAWDASGNLLWTVTLDDSIDTLKSISVDETTNDTYILADSFPPNPIVSKIDSNGNIVYTQTYSLGEQVVSNGLEFINSNQLVFASATWSDLGNDSTLHTNVINTSDGSVAQNTTYTLAQNLSRVRALEVHPSNGSYYVGINSTTNGGMPSSGTLHAYNINSNNEWHATYNASNDIRALAVSVNNEVYLMTDNQWNLAQFSTTLSQDDFQTEHFKLYPNPVRQELFISSIDNTELKSIQIYDVFGKMIWNTNTVKNISGINFSKYENGVYFVKLNTKTGKAQTHKIIKQ